MAQWIVGLTGATVALGIFIASVIFRLGRHDARVEALENWRTTIRADMHEVSDSLEAVKIELRRLATLIEERTGRKSHGGLQ